MSNAGRVRREWVCLERYNESSRHHSYSGEDEALWTQPYRVTGELEACMKNEEQGVSDVHNTPCSFLGILGQ